MIKRAQNLLAQYKEMDIAQDRVLLRIPGAWLFAFCRVQSSDQAGLFLCNLYSGAHFESKGVVMPGMSKLCRSSRVERAIDLQAPGREFRLPSSWKTRAWPLTSSWCTGVVPCTAPCFSS